MHLTFSVGNCQCLHEQFEDQWEGISELLWALEMKGIYIYERWWFHYYESAFGDFHLYRGSCRPYVFSFSHLKSFSSGHKVQSDRFETTHDTKTAKWTQLYQSDTCGKSDYFINQSWGPSLGMQNVLPFFVWTHKFNQRQHNDQVLTGSFFLQLIVWLSKLQKQAFLKFSATSWKQNSHFI